LQGGWKSHFNIFPAQRQWRWDAPALYKKALFL